MPSSNPTSIQIKSLLTVAKLIFSIGLPQQRHFITLNSKGIECLYVWHGPVTYEITLDEFDWDDIPGELNKAKSEIQRLG